MDIVIGGFLLEYYFRINDGDFIVKVVNEMYMWKDYIDSIFDRIKNSDLWSRKGYKYSDLFYYILKKYLEEFFGGKLEDFV